MFAGLASQKIAGEGTEIQAFVGGSGPPLLLLHGYPQTHYCWHKVVRRLTDAFTVVATDLRGYGDSSKPPGDARHENYSKRQMAVDQLQVMGRLGFDQFFVAGHDRGGRVAHRMALDHPAVVRKLAVLDIAPTAEMYRNTNMRFALAYFHWFFLVQPYDFPERLISADPEYYLRRAFYGPTGTADANSPVSPEAFSEYLRCFRDPAAIHASCEDYRASASIDLEHDAAEGQRKLACPLLILFGAKGRLADCFDIVALWRERATNIQSAGLPGGHYLPEELPERVADELRRFFCETSKR
jgi:haloacetate dehalogenase